MKCYYCKTELSGYNLYSYDFPSNKRITLCRICFEEKTIKCNLCSAKIPPIDDFLYKGIYLCVYCRNMFKGNCCECHKKINREKIVLINDLDYCSECATKYYKTCETCGRWIDKDLNRKKCKKCLDLEKNLNIDYRNNYYFKPNPKKIGKEDPFFGIELEVACQENNQDLNIEIAKDLLWEINSIAYLKKDTSISDCGKPGFEIVTHPLSWSWINSYYGQRMLSNIFDIKDTHMSYEAGSCGMHIHISKEYFSSIQIKRILNFFIKNEQFIKSFSKRESQSFRSWCKIPHLSSKQIDVFSRLKYSSNRNTAINLSPLQTLEFRIFRGTLNKNTFMRNLEFIHALIEMSKKKEIEQKDSLNNFLNFVKDNDYPRLNKLIESDFAYHLEVESEI